MSYIFAQIKSDSLIARKSLMAKNPESCSVKTSLLGTVLAAMQKIEKDTQKAISDADAIKVLKTFMDGAVDTRNIRQKAGEDATPAEIEISVLNTYIPKQMTREEIVEQVRTALASVTAPYSMKNMGVVMGHMNKNFAGTFDGNVVRAVFEEAIKA